MVCDAHSSNRPIAMQGELKAGVKGPFCGRWISDMAVKYERTVLLIVDEALSHLVVSFFFLCISDG